MCGECARRGADQGARALADVALDLFTALEAGGLAGAAALVAAPETRREVGGHLHRFLGYHLPGYRLPAALDMLRAAKNRGSQGDT